MKKRKNISIQSTASVIYSNSTLEGFEHCNVGTSLMVQWLRLLLSLQEAQVQSLGRELKSHKLCLQGQEKYCNVVDIQRHGNMSMKILSLQNRANSSFLIFFLPSSFLFSSNSSPPAFPYFISFYISAIVLCTKLQKLFSLSIVI